MYMSKHFPGTFREVEKGLSRSHELLLKSGFIYPQAAGIWHLLPFGFKVHQKICQLVYKTMEKYGVLNMALPILQPKEDWDKTERWEGYCRTRTMFVTTEQHSGALYGLAPTAEEMVTSLVATRTRSYKEMPIILHQIGPKFRDELRPRNGLLRGREFWMSDAYSFDVDEDGMRASFELMRKIYHEIFNQLNLNFIAVQADSGAIGGKGSSEFMALSEGGEDTLLTCDTCDYGANQERCLCLIPHFEPDSKKENMKKEHTPHARTVKELQECLKKEAHEMVKTVLWVADDKPLAVCIRGDLEINKIKLQNKVRATLLEEASPEVIERVTGAPVGFAGPIKLKEQIPIYFDESVRGMTNFICGGNEKEYHYVNVNFGKDLAEPKEYYDLVAAQPGFTCFECRKGKLQKKTGIEIGHIFQLQDRYSRLMKAYYQSQEGKQIVIQMGCYGIGTSRLLQTIAEQNHDEKGLIWPECVAPYQVVVVPVNITDEAQRQLAQQLYQQLKEKEVEVMFDDRDLRAGVKFNDAELIGFPWRITCGREAKNQKVELTCRKTGKAEVLSVEDVLKRFSKS